MTNWGFDEYVTFGAPFSAGCLLLLLVAWMRYRVSVIRSWPRTTGTMLGLGTERITYSHHDAEDASVRTKTYPRFHYEYVVDGKMYKGKRESIMIPRIDDPDEMNEYLSRYEVGKQVSVYYDPLTPSRSYLTPEVPQGGYGGVLFVALCFFALSAYIFFQQSNAL